MRTAGPYGQPETRARCPARASPSTRSLHRDRRRESRRWRRPARSAGSAAATQVARSGGRPGTACWRNGSWDEDRVRDGCGGGCPRRRLPRVGNGRGSGRPRDRLSDTSRRQPAGPIRRPSPMRSATAPAYTDARNSTTAVPTTERPASSAEGSFSPSTASTLSRMIVPYTASRSRSTLWLCRPGPLCCTMSAMRIAPPPERRPARTPASATVAISIGLVGLGGAVIAARHLRRGWGRLLTAAATCSRRRARGQRTVTVTVQRIGAVGPGPTPLPPRQLGGSTGGAQRTRTRTT